MVVHHSPEQGADSAIGSLTTTNFTVVLAEAGLIWVGKYKPLESSMNNSL